MLKTKYQFPIAIITREQLEALGKRVPEGIKIFSVFVRDADNPILYADGTPFGKTLGQLTDAEYAQIDPLGDDVFKDLIS